MPKHMFHVCVNFETVLRKIAQNCCSVTICSSEMDNATLLVCDECDLSGIFPGRGIVADLLLDADSFENPA